MKKAYLIVIVLFSFAAIANDIEAGKQKSAVCTSCHGADGNSVNPEWPKLAGQHAGFIARQLKLFKSGERSNPLMTGMVTNLTEQDMMDLAAFYSSNKTVTGSANENLVDLGKSVYMGGSKEMSIPACMACHGASGKGIPLSGYPALAGQHAKYLETRLQAYRAGEKVSDSDDVNGNVMHKVAKYLSDEEIKAVSSYLQGLYSQ